MNQQKPFYSFGIIFKNEIRCLERCLKSLQPLRDAVPCEVVMADTGSDDGSREVAERYADVLIDFPWIDDFSAARNAVMNRCSGVWYFSIDADEWMSEDIHELLDFYRARKLKLQQIFAGVMIRNLMNQGGETAERYAEFFAVRMARLDTGVRYVDCIHEHWLNPDGSKSLDAITLGKTLLYHDGYYYETKAAEKAKYERNRALLDKKLAGNPDDIQTLLECIDTCRTYDGEAAADYVRRSIEGVNQKRFAWERFGPIVFRNAVCVATLHNLPELEQWIKEGLDRFPDSIFTRVDINYYAFAWYWTQKDYAAALRHGEAYIQGMDDYRAGRFNRSEILRGVLENAAPFWEGKVLSMMPFAYLECGEPEKAFSMFRTVRAEDIGNLPQIGLSVQTLLRLHKISMLDTPSLLAEFWEKIAQPDPESEEAKKRRTEVIKAAAQAFTLSYMDDEEKEEGFRRHSCTIFVSLEGKCSLGDAAAILAAKNPALLEEKVSRFENLNELPMSALIHALNHGMRYPLPEKPLSVEEMDTLAQRMAQEQGSRFFPLVQKTLEDDFARTPQDLCWARGLALAALRANDWTTGKTPEGETSVLSTDSTAGSAWDTEAWGMEVAWGFARVEEKYLPLCYAPEALNKENLFMLPSLHRFGWYCAQAFRSLDQGDRAGYIRLLREGLTVCEDAKVVAEFLLEHTPEIQLQPEPSAELQALAEQIRTVLANFAPDDPAVVALKQSEVYQKVAWLIEGTNVPVVGGLLQ